MPLPPKFASKLGSESSESSEGGSSASGEEAAAAAPTTLANADPAPEELAALGFDGARPLAGAIPEPEPGATWEWGTSRRGEDAAQPDAADRVATQAAAASVEALALAAQAEAARRRAEALGSGRGGGGAAALGPDGKPLSYRQREKRKRDAGMQNGHKNYVEEEKRVAREMDG